MNENLEPATTSVDPDPFVAAGVFFAGAAVVLNLIMIWQTHTVQMSSAGAAATRRNRLNHMSNELTLLRRELRRITRAIDRGSANSDLEFYDVPYRIHASRLTLLKGEFQEYTEALGAALMRCGTLNNWIHNAIDLDPELAADLGQVLQQTIGDVVDELNEIMSRGDPNRRVLFEANRVLDALDTALTRALDGGNA